MAASRSTSTALVLPGVGAPVPAEPSKPDEFTLAEGNLAELPIFVLSNKEAKPKELADYKRHVVLGTRHENGQEVERSVTVTANPAYGFPTMLANRVLHAVIAASQEQRFESPFVFITRHQIAVKLGYQQPGATEYRLILDALKALRSIVLVAADCWHDKNKKTREGSVKSAGLIADFDFKDERVQSQLPLLNRDGVPQRSYVKLSDLVYASLRAGYHFGIELPYLSALGPLPGRLYEYLTKKDDQKTTYTEGVKSLGRKMNLKKTAPSDIMAALGPALDSLQREVAVPSVERRRRFLESWKYDREAAQVTVVFYRPTKERGRDRLREIQAQLEQMTPPGGKALSRS